MQTSASYRGCIICLPTVSYIVVADIGKVHFHLLGAVNPKAYNLSIEPNPQNSAGQPCFFWESKSGLPNTHGSDGSATERCLGAGEYRDLTLGLQSFRLPIQRFGRVAVKELHLHYHIQGIYIYIW